MNIINAIHVPFYQFQSEKLLVDKIFNEVKDLQFLKEPQPNHGDVYPNYYNAELFAWFDSCISQVAKLYYHEHLNFPIVDCWINKYLSLNNLKKHNHSNSVICGCFYLSDHEVGDTIFELPDPWVLNQGNYSNLLINKSTQPLQGKIKPVKGSLILFPSNLIHYMKTFTDKKNPKYTIAFNTFPSGEISNFQSMKLNIRPVSVEEQKKSGKF